jgi:hypothetical protein
LPASANAPRDLHWLTRRTRPDLSISSLVDTWLLAITMQDSGERNRGLYVLKSRGMAHSNQIREFLLSSEGVRIVLVYMGPDGVLTGSARAAAEAVGTGVGLGAGQESTQLAEAMELRGKALDARMASMWADFEAEESQTARQITATKKREDALLAARLEQGRQRTVKPEDRPAGNGAAMRPAPIGLRFAGQANDMRHVAMMASIPTHKDWTAVASAVVHAAAVGLCLSTTAEAVEPEAFLQLLGESVSDLQLPTLVLRSDPEVRRTLIQQIAEVHHWAGRPTKDVFDHFFNGA